MERYLPADEKNAFQKEYHKFVELFSRGQSAHDSLKRSRGSKIWIVGIVLLFFAMGSEFFLGAAAALFAVYFYQILSAYIQKSQAEDAMEEVERWFNKRGLVLRDKTPFFSADEQLADPIDPFDDSRYR
ncbi:hypothetical protein [Motiliproteus sp. SC1-56]|uniref:hypothetical protein n=1 Tax=Motiliproteus sp. SC1-56 TaxID=2799565 RepID=UPI001A8ED71F|nr:hypothetical protein [Motiliproteus sp. SC1-56]